MKQILSKLDLSALEQQVFVAGLELGSAPASAIAKKTGLNRVTTYEILKRLSKKGFVNIRAKRNDATKYFQVQDVAAIESGLVRQREQLDSALEGLKALVPDIRSFQKGLPDRPVVLFYEGREGIENVLMDTLLTKPYDILSFVSANFLGESFDPRFLEKYWRMRTEMKIPARGIMPRTEKATAFFTKERNVKELRQLKFLSPENYQFENQIDIYGDNIGITSLAKDGEYAVIIRSRSIAAGLRSIFNVFWNSIANSA